ncbi:trypsin-like serine peptidase [Methylobacterium aquaticum]|uniref:trypsin-like serine peptidase n=1 Tax=Methylobacterium aquaticum TaxID=270351 RepID=UPI003D16CDA5
MSPPLPPPPLSGSDMGRLGGLLASVLSEKEVKQIVYASTGDRLRTAFTESAKPLQETIVDLLVALEREGLTFLFLAGVYRERPDRHDVRAEIARVYPGVAAMADQAGPALSLQLAGGAVPSSPASTLIPGLQRNIRPNLAKLDARLWVERLLALEGQVCRVDIDGNAAGTGFLVGPDVVLTNWHVVARVKRAAIPTRVTCLFDYALLESGARGGERVGLHADGCVDDRPYAPAELTADPASPPPAADELDYALIRLARPVGAPTATGPGRGWIALPAAPVPLDPQAPLLILQHPDGAPLKLALDTESVIGANANGTRIRYRTNTDPGSSGSPCFSMDWDLAALHHFGDPAWVKPVFNQGVPADLIRASIEARGHGHRLRRPDGRGEPGRGLIPADLRQPLAQAVGETFDYGQLTLILAKGEGRRVMPTGVGPDDPPVAVARAVLEEEERRGSTREFLRLVLDERPRNDVLRNLVGRLDPTLVSAPTQTKDVVDRVVSDLRTTRRTLRDPRVRQVVEAVREALEGCADGVAHLSIYKTLHDILHQIQVRYLSGLQATPSPRQMGEADWEQLRDIQMALQTSVLDALEEVRKFPPGHAAGATELRWAEKLNEAAQRLERAIDARDSDPRAAADAWTARALIKTVFEREPSRLNGLILSVVAELPLDALVSAFEAGSGAENGASRPAALVAASTSLATLRARIRASVNEHNLWQAADDGLQLLERGLLLSDPELAEAFAVSWPAAKAPIRLLSDGSSGARWAVSLRALSDRIDDELARLDGVAAGAPSTTADLRRLFRELMGKVRVQFYLVDHQLKMDCAEIVKMGAPMQDLFAETAPSEETAG